MRASFVMDDCQLEVRAPETAQQKMVRAIEEMPETPRLGDLLVSVGAVSQDTLEQVLSAQQAGSQADGTKPKIGDLLEAQAGVAPEVVAAALGKQQKCARPVAPPPPGLPPRWKSATSACRPTGWTP